MKRQVNLKSYDALRILAKIGGSKREFAEIYSAAVGVKSGYQTLLNALRANKGLNAKQVDVFLHNLRHAEADSTLQDYKDELQYTYYLLDYLMDFGAIDRDEEMRADATTPFEERQMKRRFGNGYEPTRNGNVEGLSEDEDEDEDEDEEKVQLIRDVKGNVLVEPTKEEVEYYEKTGLVPEESTEEDVVETSEDEAGGNEGDTVSPEQDSGKTVDDLDDVLAQLLAFGAKKKQPPEEPKEPEKKNDFLSNFLGENRQSKSMPSVSNDSFDNNLANVPDVFDRDSKKF